MATVYTDVGTNQNSAGDNLVGAGTRASGLEAASGVHVAYATYTVTAALAAADVINVFKLPGNVQVLPPFLRIHTDGVTATTCTADIGLEQDPDLYATAIDLNSATTDQAGLAFDTGVSGLVAGEALTTTPAAGEWFQATIAALTGTATAGQVVSFTIFFRSIR